MRMNWVLGEAIEMCCLKNLWGLGARKRAPLTISVKHGKSKLSLTAPSPHRDARMSAKDL